MCKESSFPFSVALMEQTSRAASESILPHLVWIPNRQYLFLTFKLINPLNLIVHFWLHHTAHCTEKIASACLHTGSVSAERVGQGKVAGVTRRVTSTWWLLGLAVKAPWLGLGGPIFTWIGLKTLLSPCRGFISGRQDCFGSERVFDHWECWLLHAC